MFKKDQFWVILIVEPYRFRRIMKKDLHLQDGRPYRFRIIKKDLHLQGGLISRKEENCNKNIKIINCIFQSGQTVQLHCTQNSRGLWKESKVMWEWNKSNIPKITVQQSWGFVSHASLTLPKIVDRNFKMYKGKQTTRIFSLYCQYYSNAKLS